jgi:hypothetical protein
MQDQLLAESEAAVPAEMVREFQVAGLRHRFVHPNGDNFSAEWLRQFLNRMKDAFRAFL